MDMELVIKIPEEYYEIIKHDVSVCHNDFKPFVLIANGTPLPKGHGRLIDADGVKQIVKHIDETYAGWAITGETAIRLIFEAFNRSPTIIEAEKGAEK